MIYFDGVALEDVAPVMIEDIRVSPISIQPVVRPRAIQAGSNFVRAVGGTRNVVITFGLPVDDASQRANCLRWITHWANSEEEKWLQLPNYTDRHLEAICTELPQPSMRQWWESRLRIVFTCFSNPYWTDDTEQSVACGTSFTAAGNADDGPLIRIERTLSSAESDQSYTLGNRTMSFSTIPEGNLVIDLNRQTASVNGTSIMQYYSYFSSFLLPQNGTQTIIGTGTVKYRDRWE